MKNPIKKFAIGFISACLLVTLAQGAGFAEEKGPFSDEGWGRMDHKEKIAELKKLKAENPAEFERVVKERKEKLREKLKELKEKDPQKYQELKERMIRHRRAYLQQLRKEDPEKFQEIMRDRMAKLEELKTKDPERYNEILKDHPRLEQRLKDNANNPQGMGDKGRRKFHGDRGERREGDNF